MGNGAGLSCEVGKMILNATIFDSNCNYDTSSLNGGSALYINGIDVEMVNCIITRNQSYSTNSTIFNKDGKISIINCTSANNISSKNTVGIKNLLKSNAIILNSIFWNDGLKTEFSGTGFNVSYSCITNGYNGLGNISENPQFSLPDLPAGTNEHYGDREDGLSIKSNSPCRDKGIIGGTPMYDIVLMPRPYGTGIDIGAYEYEEYESQQNVFGYLNNGILNPIVKLRLLDICIRQNT